MDWPLKSTPSIFPLWACPSLAHSWYQFFKALFVHRSSKGKEIEVYTHFQEVIGWRSIDSSCLKLHQTPDEALPPNKCSKRRIFQSFCQSSKARNDHLNQNTWMSPPSKQAGLIACLLWCMDGLSEVICHTGGEKMINNRDTIYSSKPVVRAYWCNGSVWVSYTQTRWLLMHSYKTFIR